MTASELIAHLRSAGAIVTLIRTFWGAHGGLGPFETFIIAAGAPAQAMAQAHAADLQRHNNRMLLLLLDEARGLN